MKRTISTGFVCGVALLSFTACTKKQAAPDTAAVVQTATNEAADATPAPAVAAAPAPAISANSQKELADARAALAAKDYSKAVTLLTTLQRPGRALTPEQSAAVQAQMQQLQGSLANAVASGDPNARAAAEKLRAAAAH